MFFRGFCFSTGLALRPSLHGIQVNEVSNLESVLPKRNKQVCELTSFVVREGQSSHRQVGTYRLAPSGFYISSFINIPLSGSTLRPSSRPDLLRLAALRSGRQGWVPTAPSRRDLAPFTSASTAAG